MTFDEFVDIFRFRKFEPFAPYEHDYPHHDGPYYRVPGVDGLFLAARDRGGSGTVIMGAVWVCNEYWLARVRGRVEHSSEELPPRVWDVPVSEGLPPDVRQGPATRWLVDKYGSIGTGAAYFHDGTVNYAEIDIMEPRMLELRYGTDERMSDELPVSIGVTFLSADREGDA